MQIELNELPIQSVSSPTKINKELVPLKKTDDINDAPVFNFDHLSIGNEKCKNLILNIFSVLKIKSILPHI